MKYNCSIVGNTGVYSVSLDKGKYSCTCPHWQFRLSRQPDNPKCRHINEAIVKNLLPSDPTISLDVSPKRYPRAVVIHTIEVIRKAITPHVKDYEICGSWRRGKSDVKDLDVIVCIESEQINAMITNLVKAGGTLVKGSGEVIKRFQFPIFNKDSCINNNWNMIQCEISSVPYESWGTALCHYTGSMMENIRLRSIATNMGYSLSQYGFTNNLTKEIIHFRTEYEVYNFLNIPYVPIINR